MTLKGVAITAVILLLPLSTLAAERVAEKNVRAVVSNSEVCWNFDISGPEGAVGQVGLTVTMSRRRTDGGSLHLRGDTGEVPVGPGKSICWDVLADHPAGLNTSLVWELSVKEKPQARGATREEAKPAAPQASSPPAF